MQANEIKRYAQRLADGRAKTDKRVKHAKDLADAQKRLLCLAINTGRHTDLRRGEPRTSIGFRLRLDRESVRAMELARAQLMTGTNIITPDAAAVWAIQSPKVFGFGKCRKQ